MDNKFSIISIPFQRLFQSSRYGPQTVTGYAVSTLIPVPEINVTQNGKLPWSFQLGLLLLSCLLETTQSQAHIRGTTMQGLHPPIPQEPQKQHSHLDTLCLNLLWHTGSLHWQEGTSKTQLMHISLHRAAAEIVVFDKMMSRRLTQKGL